MLTTRPTKVVPYNLPKSQNNLLGSNPFEDLIDEITKEIEKVWNDIEDSITHLTEDFIDFQDDFWNDIAAGDFSGAFNDFVSYAEEVGVTVSQSPGITTLRKQLSNILDEPIYLAEWILSAITGENLTCDKHTPNPLNYCTLSLDQTINIEGMCTLMGSFGDEICRDGCDEMGEEWTFKGRGDNCNYNNCDSRSEMGGGCCSICCPNPGKKCTCKRKVFAADPLTCCLQDLACTVSDINDYGLIKRAPQCFTGNYEKTCDPSYRDAGSATCTSKISDFCLGVDLDPNSTEWYKRWYSTSEINGVVYDRLCVNYLYRIAYGHNNISCNLNNDSSLINELIDTYKPTSEGLSLAQDLTANMISKYYSQGGSLTGSESSESDDRLNETIYEICSNSPGLCSQFLYKLCNPVSTESLTRDPLLTKWCGCYMPPEQYQKYTNYYGISRECTPTCNMSGVVPLPSDDYSGTKRCKQSFCVIDDVSVTIAQSTVNSVNFNQLCGSCNDTNICDCVVTGANITTVDSQIGNISVSQSCSAQSQCYAEVKNVDGSITRVPVDCIGDFDEEQNKAKDTQKQAEISLMWQIVIIAIVVILILLVLSWFLIKDNTNS